MYGRRGIAQGNIRTDRGFSRFAINVSEATVAFRYRSVAWLRGKRTGLAVARNSSVDKVWITFADLVRPQSPFFHGAGLKVFDQHVGIVQQIAQNLSAFWSAQIER